MYTNIQKFKKITKGYLAGDIIMLIICQILMIVFISKPYPFNKWWIGIIIGVVGIYVFSWGILSYVITLKKVKDNNFDKKIIKVSNILAWVSLINLKLHYSVYKLKRIKQG